MEYAIAYSISWLFMIGMYIAYLNIGTFQLLKKTVCETLYQLNHNRGWLLVQLGNLENTEPKESRIWWFQSFNSIKHGILSMLVSKVASSQAIFFYHIDEPLLTSTHLPKKKKVLNLDKKKNPSFSP